jgi:hypothetical protein
MQNMGFYFGNASTKGSRRLEKRCSARIMRATSLDETVFRRTMNYIVRIFCVLGVQLKFHYWMFTKTQFSEYFSLILEKIDS